MANVDRIGRVAADYADVADFLTVYIEEAHPADGWSFEGNYHIRAHRSAEERIGAASLLAARDRRMAVVADAMTDEANRAYGALFERLYVIQNGVVVYQGQRGPHGFRVCEVEEWLRNYRLVALQSNDPTTPSDIPIPNTANPC